MAVAFSATGQWSGTNLGSLSVNITPAGANPYVLLAVAYESQAGQTGFATGPTYAGSYPMVSIGGGGAFSTQIGLFGIVAPVIGARVIDFTMLDASDIVACAVAYNGVDPVTPLGGFYQQGATGLTTAAGVNGTPDGSMVFDCAVLDIGAAVCTAVAHGGQTERVNAQVGASGFRLRLVGSDDAGGGDTSAQWTLSTSQEWWAMAQTLLPFVSSASARIRRSTMIRSVVGTRLGEGMA